MEWQPVETGPEELETCLLYCPDPLMTRQAHEGVVMGRFMFGNPYGHGMNGDWVFTHWMPLPKPPSASN